jgi:hypothetical protein
MELGNAAQILVIILAAFLALFLLLAIIAVVKIIQVLNHLKAISEKAERLATSAESIGEFFKYTAGPAAIGKLLSNVTDAVLKHRKKGD